MNDEVDVSARTNMELDLVKQLEGLRRERVNAVTLPLPTDLVKELAFVSGQQSYLSDYSHYLNMLSAAKTALEESLPNGQLKRSSLAMVVMELGCAGLKTWLRARGYIPDLHGLMMLDRSAEVTKSEDSISIPGRVFAKGRDGDIIETSYSYIKDSSLITKVSQLVQEVELDGVKRRTYRILESTYPIITGQVGYNMVTNPKYESTNYVYSDGSPNSTNSKPAVPPKSDKDGAEEVPFWKDPSNAVAKSEEGYQVFDPEIISDANGRVLSFIDECTGIRMDVDKYYIISDSGSSHTDQGFPNVMSALKWIAEDPESQDYGPGDVGIPTFDFETDCWKENDGVENIANVVYGDHVLRYNIKTQLENATETLEVILERSTAAA